jgi:hypothetical protein
MLSNIAPAVKNVKKEIHGPLQEYQHSRRFEQVHLDIWSGVPTSKLGHIGVLVMTDRASRYVMAVPIRNKQADTITKIFITHWVKIFGIPEGILTDGGGEFEGIWEEICK